MTINNRLKELYEEWRKVYEKNEHEKITPFVSGCVINEDKYAESKIKTLLLLKEGNNGPNKYYWENDWCQCMDINHGLDPDKKPYPIWRRAGEWFYGIKYDFPKYHDAYDNYQEGTKYLAVTNIKKQGASSKSDMRLIRKRAIIERDLWESEIEIIDPDIVLCGGKGPDSLFQVVADILVTNKNVCTIDGVRFFEVKLKSESRSRIFLEFFHPAIYILQNRPPETKLSQYLYDTLRNGFKAIKR